LKINPTMVDCIHSANICVPTREIWMHGVPRTADSDYDLEETGVDYTLAAQMIKNLSILMKTSMSEPIIIYSSVCGGDAPAGFAIYDMVKSCPFHVTIIGLMHVRSMSSIIFQAADKRIMMENAYFLFHYGTESNDTESQAFISGAEFSKKQNKTMIDIYVDSIQRAKTEKFEGKTDKQIATYLKKRMGERTDVYLTAEEAVVWGLADAVFTEWKDYR